jgi:branched-chain amino acid aminotransferase
MPIEPTKYIWFQGEMVPWEEAQVHVLTHTLHYGMGVFEGIRVYEADGRPAIFRLHDHVRRLFKSARLCQMEIPFSEQAICEATVAVVRENGLREGYIRPLAFLGYGEMGLNPLSAEVKVIVAAWPWGTYLGEAYERGARVLISSWRRHDPNSMPSAAKGVGMYLNSSLAKLEAVKRGYDEALMLNPQGYLAEGTGENIFLVKEGQLLTPPTGASGALEGITRDSIIRLAADMGVACSEVMLSRSDLYLADEAFLTGTAAEVVPIIEADDRRIGAGVPGTLTKELQRAYAELVRGKLHQYKDWLTYVE